MMRRPGHLWKFGSFAVAGPDRPLNLHGDSSGPLRRNQRGAPSPKSRYTKGRGQVSAELGVHLREAHIYKETTVHFLASHPPCGMVAMSLREMGWPAFMTAIGSCIGLRASYTCIHRIRSQDDRRSENHTMKMSSRRLYHRFMLSRYTNLTTTRGRRERNLNHPRATERNHSVGPSCHGMLTKGGTP